MGEPVKIFFSHPWSGPSRTRTANLIRLLRRNPDFTFKNTAPTNLWGLAATSDEALEAGLRQRIDASDAVVFVAGPWVMKSRWMRYEIGYAHAMGKPVVGVLPQRAKAPDDLVAAWQVELVGWHSPTIIARIRPSLTKRIDAKVSPHATASRGRIPDIAREIEGSGENAGWVRRLLGRRPQRRTAQRVAETDTEGRRERQAS